MQNTKYRYTAFELSLDPDFHKSSVIIRTEKCPDCGNMTLNFYGSGSMWESGCGMCMRFTYEIKNKNMEKFICTKTFVNDNTEFRRYYYGEEITEKEYFKLSGRDQGNFKRVLQDG